MPGLPGTRLGRMAAADAPSIVVFTRGRPAFVHRLARYYGDYPGQLVVVDGSAGAVAGLRMPARGEYLHRPGMSVHGRIATYIKMGVCFRANAIRKQLASSAQK